jgi:hypothetical protein
VRLNKLTGELTLVKSALPQPAARAPRPARPEAAIEEALAPRQLRVPLVTMTAGSVLPVAEVADDWLMVRFEDDQWGPRVGYIHCSTVEVALESDVVSTAAAR